MDKNFDHKQHEEKIISAWEKSGIFAAPSFASTLTLRATAGKPTKKTFCIIMPPPNANDPMHIGHAMFVAIEDILIRYHRMNGDATLWLPGTDHAGIETQFVFEKKLAKTGKSRYDFDRTTLYQMIADYVDENSGVAIDQMKRLGASADWSKLKFTLDPEVVKLVIATFKKLNDDGLVYKKEKLINYCTKCGTGYSELEVEYEEKTGVLYYIKYPLLDTPSPVVPGAPPSLGGADKVESIIVATTRPETMFGDTAIAVNPKDDRYRKLVGQEVELPLVGRKIRIIADEMVDPEFGTGAVKVTPAHDQNDYEVAERHNLPLIKVIGTNGKMTTDAGKYAGLSASEAREKIIADLGEKLIDIKTITHNVGTCYRCHRTIESLPLPQFFIKVEPLAKKALEALDKGETVILGAGREKILRHWLTNLRDWNISRQIVWGIRMPVWYLNGDMENFIVSETSPGDGYEQETDSFDTWFSSGQWPVVTLKTSGLGDFENYYPTDVMETGYDILPIWVMRMMMLGIYMTGKTPFKWVYLHGLIRDEQGRKMSKSIGNVVNPMVLVDKYGTDALRMALVMSTTPGNDSNVGEAKVRGMRNLANKIWNAARYVIENLKQKTDSSTSVGMTQPTASQLGGQASDEEFKKKIESVVEEVTGQLESLKIGLAAETVYNEFWHWFCDEAIEAHKNLKISDAVLAEGLATFLKLLHPFVPFVTEAVWNELFPNEGLLAASSWPK